MKRGEKIVLAIIGVVLLAGFIKSQIQVEQPHDRDIPFYSTASADVASKAMDIYRDNNCRSCHSLWTLKDTLQSVPAPMLDGIGSLRSEQWLYEYLSASNPQNILPTRLKKGYQMPSYANLSEADRRTMAAYLASLKVQDWYLEQTKKFEYEKLYGVEMKK